MSGLAHLRALAGGKRPADDGLLGNARCGWGRGELPSEEAILAAFTAQPFDLEGDMLAVETPLGAALIGDDRVLVADLYGGRIGRLWRVGDVTAPAEPVVDVAFDADMRQERGDVSFRQEDHPDLDAAATDRLLAAARHLVDSIRTKGKLRVRGFVVRAFGDTHASAALLSLYTLGNEASRSASFSSAVIGVGSDPGDERFVIDRPQSRAWTSRL